MIWKQNKGTFRVCGGDGWTNHTETHYISYPFIINRSRNNQNRWALTHIACGREIGNFRLLKIAKECAESLSVYDHWFLPTAELILDSMQQDGSRADIMYTISNHRSK